MMNRLEKYCLRTDRIDLCPLNLAEDESTRGDVEETSSATSPQVALTFEDQALLGLR